jgi:ABC-2 type transport system permease protein
MIGTLAPSTMPAASAPARNERLLASMLPASRSGTTRTLARPATGDLIFLIAAMLCLFFVVKWLIGVPIAGSVPLFALGLSTYLFSVTALGIMLATIVRSMPQFGLLAFPVFISMSLLSGGQTPLESMPIWLQKVMQFVPSTHFVSFSQAVLFRNATLSMVWVQLAAMFAIGSAYTAYTLVRFRKMLAAIQ